MNSRIFQRVDCRHTKMRRGVSTIEITVACTLLSALFALGGTLFVRVYRIGQDAQYRSIALQEVANELELRLKQSAEQRASSGDAPPPSESVRYRWPEAKFQYLETQDDLGTRITVELILNPDPLAKTVQLSGWIVEDQPSPRSEP